MLTRSELMGSASTIILGLPMISRNDELLDHPMDRVQDALQKRAPAEVVVVSNRLSLRDYAVLPETISASRRLSLRSSALAFVLAATASPSEKEALERYAELTGSAPEVPERDFFNRVEVLR